MQVQTKGQKSIPNSTLVVVIAYWATSCVLLANLRNSDAK